MIKLFKKLGFRRLPEFNSWTRGAVVIHNNGATFDLYQGTNGLSFFGLSLQEVKSKLRKFP